MTHQAAHRPWWEQPFAVWGMAVALMLVSVVAVGFALDWGGDLDGPFESADWPIAIGVVCACAPGALLAGWLLTVPRRVARAVGYVAVAGTASVGGFLTGLVAFFTLCVDSPPDPCGHEPVFRVAIAATAVVALLSGAALHIWLLRRRGR